MDIQWQFRRGILQKAINVAARPITKAAKTNARKIKDSGTLAKRTRHGVITGFGKYVAPERVFKTASGAATAAFVRDFEAALRAQIDLAQKKAARKAHAALRKTVGGAIR